jgi:hypothetical protein
MMMKNKKVKQMMVDIERYCLGEIYPAWLFWFDGVCLVAGANFLWVNHNNTVSIKSGDRR